MNNSDESYNSDENSDSDSPTSNEETHNQEETDSSEEDQSLDLTQSSSDEDTYHPKRQTTTNRSKGDRFLSKKEMFCSLSALARNMLQSQGIDHNLFLDMTNEHIRQSEIPLGDAVRIHKCQQLKNFEPSTSSPPPAQSLKKSRKHPIKDTKKIYSGKLNISKIPKWDPKKPSMNPREYIRKIELIFKSENYDPAMWHVGLELAMEGSAVKWAHRTLSAKGMNWATAKDLFCQYFGRKDQALEDLNSWTSCVQGANESLLEYNERFLDAATQCKAELDAKMTILFYERGLHSRLQQLYASTTAKNRPKDVLEAIEIANYLDTSSRQRKAGSFIPPATSDVPHPHKEKTVIKDKGRLKLERKNGIAYPKNGCWNHPYLRQGDRNFHAGKDCKEDGKRSEGPGTSKDGLKPEAMKQKEIKCYGCGESGHKRPQCPHISNKAISIIQGHLDPLESEMKSLEHYFDIRPESKSICNTSLAILEGLPGKAQMKVADPSVDTPESPSPVIQGSERKELTKNSVPIHNSESVLFPVEIEGEQATAYYDTGCEGSAFMNESYAMRRGFRIIPVRGEIHLGNEGTKVPRKGHTVSLQVRVPGHTVRTVFEVMHLKHDVFIGTKLGRQLGISIHGLPCQSMQFKMPGPLVKDLNPSIMEKECVQPHPSHEVVLAGIAQLLEENQKVTGFCQHPEATVRLNLHSTEPVYIRQYRIAERFHAAITLTIQEWERKGVVKQIPHSRFNNPLTVSLKKDLGTGQKSIDPANIRVNFDGRSLNARMADYIYELPKISEVFEALAGAAIFSAIDIKDAFCTFPIHKEDRKYLAFTWQEKHYIWKGAPFGLKILSFQFQRIMRILLTTEASWARVFIDDIIVYSRSVNDHLLHLKRVIMILTENNLKISLTKSSFGFESVFLLGHKISKEGVEIDRRKLIGMASWPRPTASSIEHHLGLFNYFRSFIPKYAQVTAPLDRVRKRFTWGDEQEAAWTLIKELLSEAPLLHHPDFQKPFYSASDASNSGIAAVLFQKHDDLREMGSHEENKENCKIITFAARSLQPAERNYSATKKEALAVNFSITKFRYYLYGRRFKHYTDHKALVWLFKQQDDNRVINTWIDNVLEMDGMEVVHLPGIVNVLPDHLSRLFQGCDYLAEGVVEDKQMNSITRTDTAWTEEISKMISALSKIKKSKHTQLISSIIKVLRPIATFDKIFKSNDGTVLDTWGQKNFVECPADPTKAQRLANRAKRMAVEEGRFTVLTTNNGKRWWQKELEAAFQSTIIHDITIYFITPARAKAFVFTDASHQNINRLQEHDDLYEVMLKDERNKLMEDHHALGHFGGLALQHAIIQSGHRWSSMSKDCHTFVRQCLDCARYNINKNGYHPYTPIIAKLPMDHISMDLYQLDETPDGFNYILIVVDICTRFVFLRPLRNKDAVTVAKKLFKMFCQVGFPRVIQSDNGTEFVNSTMKALTTAAAMEHRMITAYHPRANGTSERFVRTTKTAIFKELRGAATTWVPLVPMIQYATNIKVSTLHASSPFSFFFGRKYNALTDWSEAMTSTASKDELEKRMEFLTNLVYPELAQHVEDVQHHRKTMFDANHTMLDLPKGALVMVRNDVRGAKSSAAFEGPFTVERRTRGGSYILRDGDGQELHRRYAPSQIKLIGGANEGDKAYIVESIHDDKRIGSERWYLTKWKGYDESENTWTRERDFLDLEIIRRYWKNKGLGERADGVVAKNP